MGTQENLQGALTMRGDATLGANNHILVLVNGRPIQESTHGGMIHPFLRSFPLASVKQIEIIRGPGSVLYGTNAYVGVINVITKVWDVSGSRGHLLWGVRYHDRLGGGREDHREPSDLRGHGVLAR